jgi:hypothetical protein
VLRRVVQNTNACMAGVSQAVAGVFMPLWQRGDDIGAGTMLLAETTTFQYPQGARDPAALNPDACTHDQSRLDRPGRAERPLALFKDDQTHVAAHDAWQACFRAREPETLVTWGQGDPFFTAAGAGAFLRDLPQARLAWPGGGHFAPEADDVRVAGESVNAFGGR